MKELEKFYRGEVSSGNAKAMFQLADFLELGSPSERQKDEADALRLKSAELGHPRAREAMALRHYNLGLRSIKTDSDPCMSPEAVKNFESAAAFGCAGASVFLGKIFAAQSLP